MIDDLLNKMEPADASDLHMMVGMKPRFRVHGELFDVEGTVEFSKDQLNRLTLEILTEDQGMMYQEAGEIDFAYGALKSGRFRCNYFQEQRGPSAVFRRIPSVVRSLGELNMPPVVETLAHLRTGLILVTGPTGSGKTSTLAALVDLINAQYRKHIITLEDPIEYLHPSKKSVVHQRGLYYDFLDFAGGVRAALREDPDIILIGEMRDLETIHLALTAAEAGSLVFGTLHTNGAAQSIDRIIDVFPSEEQPQIRAMLSQTFAGAVSQVLLRRSGVPGRIPATEVLLGNPAVSNIIREAKIQDITSVIQTGKSQGMHTMDDSLISLITRKMIAAEEAYSYASNKSWFEQFLGGAATDVTGPVAGTA